MPSIKKRGDSYRIMVSLGYDMEGKQVRKTTTFTPPEGVTPGKAEKLAISYAHEFEKRCMGMVNMNENIRFSELHDWYFDQIAVHKLKPMTLYGNKELMKLYVLPYLGTLTRLESMPCSMNCIGTVASVNCSSFVTPISSRKVHADLYHAGQRLI